MSTLEIILILLQLVPLFAAITLHEYAHGWMAQRLGDPTAQASGRLTLNPLAHLDLFGTVLLPLTLLAMKLLLYSSIPVIGYARPVPVNPLYFKHPYRDMMQVAIAGPCTNALLAVVSALLLHALASFADLTMTGIAHDALEVFVYILVVFVLINVLLGLFNLIPVPPLDGSRILAYFLPQGGRVLLHRLEPVGFLFIVALLWWGRLDQLIDPLLVWAEGLIPPAFR